MPHVLVLCHGNICRSPMGEFLLRERAREAGVDLVVTSAGVSAEEQGHGIDPRADRELRRRGVPVGVHTAHRVTRAELAAADLVVVMSHRHLRAATAMLPELAEEPTSGSARIALIRSFDPASPHGAEVPDPWYGDAAGFADTFDALDACMPGLLAWAQEQPRHN